MTGKSDIYTFLDCPDLGELFKEQCYYGHLVHGGTCKIRCEERDCERGYAR